MISDVGYLLFGLAIGGGAGLSETPGTTKAVLVALIGGGGLIGGVSGLSGHKIAISLFSIGFIVGIILGSYIRAHNIVPCPLSLNI